MFQALKESIACTFEDPYLCGYSSDTFGLSKWFRKQAFDKTTFSGGPKSDDTMSVYGKIIIIVTYMNVYVLVFNTYIKTGNN